MVSHQHRCLICLTNLLNLRHGRYLTVAAVFRGRMSMKEVEREIKFPLLSPFIFLHLISLFVSGGRADAEHPEQEQQLLR